MTQDTPNAIPAPPPRLGRAVKWARANLFRTWLDSLVTVLFLVGVALILPPLIQWAFIDTNLDARNVRECHQSGGACWAFIGEKARLMLFGLYSGDEWRPTAAIAILLTTIVAAARGWLRGRALIAAITVGTIAILVLMHGGMFGMPVATTRTWGRPAADTGVGDGQPCRRFPARRAAGAGPPVRASGDPHSLRHLYRGRPRCSADHRAVHGVGDAAAVPAGRRERRQRPARPDRHDRFRRRLSGGSRSRRPSGSAQGAIRSRRRIGPFLLAEDAHDHSAASAAGFDPADRQTPSSASSRTPRWSSSSACSICSAPPRRLWSTASGWAS